jgi:hypothetical protein
MALMKKDEPSLRYSLGWKRASGEREKAAPFNIAACAKNIKK